MCHTRETVVGTEAALFEEEGAAELHPLFMAFLSTELPSQPPLVLPPTNAALAGPHQAAEE